MKGIDVSLWQGEIDWKAVKADGVSFAMIKASEGGAGGPASRIVDPRFRQNIENAAAAGIACGVYHYLTAASPEEARREADFFLETVRPFSDRIALWAAADMERAEGTDRTALTDTVLAFLERVKEGGLCPMLYANSDYIRHRYDYPRLAAYPLWYACWYDAAGEEERPERDFAYLIWQQGSGRVDGVSGLCDIDYGVFPLPREESGDPSPAEDPAAEETPEESRAGRLRRILVRILRFLLRLLEGDGDGEGER